MGLLKGPLTASYSPNHASGFFTLRFSILKASKIFGSKTPLVYRESFKFKNSGLERSVHLKQWPAMKVIEFTENREYPKYVIH